MIAILNTRKKGPKREQDTSQLAPDAYIVSIGNETRNYCFKLLNTLRQSGISVDMDYECRSPKAQMRTANKLNSRFTIVIGPDELEKGVIKLKDMQTGEEKLAEDANEVVQVVQQNK